MSVLSRLIQIKRTREAQARVVDRVKRGLCLGKVAVSTGSTELVDCDRKADGQRGNCKRCTSVLYREKNKGTPEQSAEYEHSMIEEGLTLGNGEMRELRRTSGFQIKRKRSAS